MEQIKENKKWFSKLGIAYLISSLIFNGLQIAAAIIFGMVNPEFYKANVVICILLPVYVLGLPLMYLIIKRIPATKIEKKPFSAGKLIACFLVAFSAMYIGNLCGTVINLLLSGIAGTTPNNAVQELIMGNTLWQNILMVCILGPIVEELLFRKFLIDRVIRFGEGTAILLSGLMFGFFHGNIVQFIYAGLLGCVFAYVYIKSGDIKKSIVLHIAINTLGSVVAPLVLIKSGYMEMADKLSEPGADTIAITTQYMGAIAIMLTYFLILFVMVVTGIVIFCMNRKKIEILEGEVVIEKKDKFKTLFLNLGMILFVIFWIAMMIFSIVGN